LIAKKLLQHPEYGINLVGFVDNGPGELDEDLAHVALLGSPDGLTSVARLFDVERVIVAFPNGSHEEMLELVRSLRDMNVQVDIVPRLFETVGPNMTLHMVEGLALLGLPPLRLSRSSALLKRAMDLLVSTFALLILSPLLLVVALVVKLDSRGPVLYRHERVGRAGKRIEVLKFRTMRLESCRGDRYGGASAEATFQSLLADPERAREFADSYKLANDPRVTRVGRLLRATSIDELPQLANVFKGDLSLVGPRAITAEELPRYGNRVEDLLAIRPGVTGYWQINGRSRLRYDDRVRLDLSYVAGWSLSLDLTILAKTLRVLLRRADAF
jgi:exopolysaccharide biosynthesis polyprenyl glycosylphosphotransferase